MRVAFAGTPPFAARALEALLQAGHDVPLVLCQPDRPSGRGLKPIVGAVHALANARGIPVHQPVSLRSPEAQQPLRDAHPEVLVVAAYGLLLPQSVLDIPPQGCWNIHASLLPRWRGAAPIQRALLAGDAETGVGIMQMEAGLDTGPVIVEKRLPIEETDTAGGLTTKLAELGALAIVEALAHLDRWSLRSQDAAQATYAAKIDKKEARIDWRHSAETIHRQIRAFNPRPGAETSLDGALLKVWEARPASGTGAPGEVLPSADASLLVACGQGALALTTLQRAGARRLPASEFLRGSPVYPGTILGVVGALEPPG